MPPAPRDVIIVRTLECQDCDPRWPVLVRAVYSGDQLPACPHCGSQNVQPPTPSEE